jgi:hypothetical protein
LYFNLTYSYNHLFNYNFKDSYRFLPNLSLVRHDPVSGALPWDNLGMLQKAELIMSKCTIAAGLLARENIRALGTNFTRIYPIDEAPRFGALLRAIDEADSKR